MRQLTCFYFIGINNYFSKLPMRQLTRVSYTDNNKKFSKLPMRQLTDFDPNNFDDYDF